MKENPEAQRAPEQTPIFGVFLFVTNEFDEALMLINKQTKASTHKLTGQFTTPAETIHNDESIINDAIHRTIEEEVGKINGKLKPEFRGYAHLSLDRPIYLACYEIRTKKNRVVFKPADITEVANAHWVPLDQIDKRLMPSSHGLEIPRYRTPIPEFAENVRLARMGAKFPLVKKVGPSISPDAFNN